MRTVKRSVKLIGSGIYGLLGQTIRFTEHRPIANTAKVSKELNLQISFSFIFWLFYFAGNDFIRQARLSEDSESQHCKCLISTQSLEL